MDAPKNPLAAPGRAEQLLRTAVARHRAGDLVGAARLYRQLLQQSPDHVEALHLLGLTQAQSGAPAAAITAIERVVTLAPDFELAHYNLGNAYRAMDRIEDAVASYERALALDREMAPAWTNLGASLRALGRGDAAIAAYRHAAALQPGNAQAHYNLGCGLQHEGALEDAVVAYRRAVALKPDHADAQGNLASALLALERPVEALPAARAHVTLLPGYASGHRGLAAALLALGAPAEAAAAARNATRLDPGDPEAWLQLGHGLREAGQAPEAVRSYRRALALAPASAATLVALGIGLQELGDTEEARAVVKQALALDPASAAAWAVWGGLKTFAVGDPELAILADLADTLAAQIASPGKADALDDLVHIEFTLGKALMDAGDAPRAFAALASANRRQRARLDYDVDRDIAGLAGIARALDGSRMADLAGHGAATRRPIFIVGMPRSGTTLVEQILSAHPAIHGGGEMKYLELVLLDRFQGASSRPDWPERLQAISGRDIAELAEAYLARIAPLAPAHMLVTDKMPSNFRHAGLIHLMFPASLIIHCRRAMLDNCLSCFATHFAQGQPFTYDLRELGAYYRGYAGLMDHWRQVIPPDRLMEVDYEDVVGDLGGQARRLIAAAGLAWDDACLDFHRTARQVRTASVNQVRRPLYATSIGRWEPYADYLGPLGH